LEREKLMAQVRELLEPPLTREELEAHFANLPQRYFEAHSAREILEDLKVARQFLELLVLEADRGLEPAIRWQPLPDRACDAAKIGTWDRAGLFGKIAGCFSATGFNILSAQIFTRADGLALDTFAVTNAQTGALADREQRTRFNDLLIEVLAGQPVELRALIARQRDARPLYQSYEGERLPTRVTFDNSTSESRTVIEVETEDRIGLLFAISQTLAELGLDISTAKISTEKGAAIDSFYVSGLDGHKVTDSTRLKLIERDLQHAIYGLDASPR
jgi:[protein-PII] uridylyltransferase